MTSGTLSVRISVVRREIAIKWYRQACHDLLLAEKNISIEGYDVAAFLAHQAVEKLLKALIIAEKNTLPRIHYLDELAQQLGLQGEIADDIADLTADYTVARYPDVSDRLPFEEYDRATASEKVERAGRIFRALETRRRGLGIE